MAALRRITYIRSYIAHVPMAPVRRRRRSTDPAVDATSSSSLQFSTRATRLFYGEQTISLGESSKDERIHRTKRSHDPRGLLKCCDNNIQCKVCTRKTFLAFVRTLFPTPKCIGAHYNIVLYDTLLE